MHILSNILRCLILFLIFACNNFPFCAFVTVIYWTLTKMLLSPVAPLNSAVPSLDFEQIKVFWTSNFDSVSIVIYSFGVKQKSPLHCVYHIRFKCCFFWPWENRYIVHGFDSISITQFSAMICPVSAEGCLNHVPHLI